MSMVLVENLKDKLLFKCNLKLGEVSEKLCFCLTSTLIQFQKKEMENFGNTDGGETSRDRERESMKREERREKETKIFCPCQLVTLASINHFILNLKRFLFFFSKKIN